MDRPCPQCNGRGYRHGNDVPADPPSAMPCSCDSAAAIAHIATVTGQPASQLRSSPLALPDGTAVELVVVSHLRGAPWWLVEVTADGAVRGVLCRTADPLDAEGSLRALLAEYQEGRRTPYGISPCQPTGVDPAAAPDQPELPGESCDPFAGTTATAEQLAAWAEMPWVCAAEPSVDSEQDG